jgi:hypothetical protein
MLELKEPLEEREALKKIKAQNWKEEGLNEHGEKGLLNIKEKLNQMKEYLLRLGRLAEHSPRDYEEYELLLKPKGYSKYYDLKGGYNAG